MERESETVHLDGNSGIDPGKTLALPPNLGANPTRLYSVAKELAEEKAVQLILWILH
jgi:hypothetical protein